MHHDFLEALPKEVLHHVIQRFLCRKSEEASNNRIACRALQALRRCSKLLLQAVDSARLFITLHPTRLANSVPYLQRMGSLGILGIQCAFEDLANTLRLDVIDAAALQLSGLSMIGGCTGMQVLNLDACLVPWRLSLVHLVMQFCRVGTATPNCSSSGLQTSWTPDLPVLFCLTIVESDIVSLDLSACTKLQVLELRSNRQLTQLAGLSRLQELNTVKFGGLCPLKVLDLSGSQSLLSLECSASLWLKQLNIAGCHALQKLECNHGRLTALDISGCQSLVEIECYSQSSLIRLDLSRLERLQDVCVMYCDRLVGLNLSGCMALTSMDCQCNKALASLNLAGCASLHNQGERDPLGAIYTSGSPSLKINYL